MIKLLTFNVTSPLQTSSNVPKVSRISFVFGLTWIFRAAIGRNIIHIVKETLWTSNALPSPLLSILDAVFTVSPNKQYLGIFRPTTPATQGPEITIQPSKYPFARFIDLQEIQETLYYRNAFQFEASIARLACGVFWTSSRCPLALNSSSRFPWHDSSHSSPAVPTQPCKRRLWSPPRGESVCRNLAENSE